MLINRGRAWNSPALSGDGHHLVSDVITSVGVLAGLVLATLTGWSILDPLLAGAVALNILRIGYQLAVESMSQLMDEAASPGDRGAHPRGDQRQRATARCRRTTSARARPGRRPSSSSTSWCPGDMTVEAAHDICDRLEDAIEAEIEGADVVIHVEPEYKAKRKGAVEL